MEALRASQILHFRVKDFFRAKHFVKDFTEDFIGIFCFFFILSCSAAASP